MGSCGAASDEATKSLAPFYWVAAGWALAGTLFCLATHATGSSYAWFFGLWAICALDLMAIGQLVRALLVWMSPHPGEMNPLLLTQIVLWAAIKLVCLCLFGLVLWMGHSAPGVALLWGMGTLLAVPLLGGLWWTHKESSNAQRA